MSDLISRQAAIDALGEEPPVWYDGEDEIAERNQWRRDVNAIKAVPSVQSEIIRCKDCRWKYGAECVRFAEIRPFPDDFCSRAERRTDDSISD